MGCSSFLGSNLFTATYKLSKHCIANTAWPSLCLLFGKSRNKENPMQNIHIQVVDTPLRLWGVNLKNESLKCYQNLTKRTAENQTKKLQFCSSKIMSHRGPCESPQKSPNSTKTSIPEKFGDNQQCISGHANWQFIASKDVGEPATLASWICFFAEGFC